METSQTVQDFGVLASRLTWANAADSFRGLVQHPQFVPALKQIATELVTSGVLFAIIFYHFSMKWMEHKFKNRDLYEKNKKFWKMLMAGYNLVLSVYSAVTCVVSFQSLSQSGMYSADCGKVFRDVAFEWAARIFYWSKFVEFADTYFLVVAGKYVSWLQYFHHAGACLDMWVLFRFQNEGIWIFVQFDSFIHTIMYAYFTATALGISVPGKQIVTLLQILQLTVGNSLSFPYIVADCYKNDPFRMIGWTISCMYITVLVGLFVHFAVTSYILPKKGGKGKSAKSVKADAAAAASKPAPANGSHAVANGDS